MKKRKLMRLSKSLLADMIANAEYERALLERLRDSLFQRIDEMEKKDDQYYLDEKRLMKERDEAQEANKKLSAEILALHRAIADDFIYRSTMRRAKNIVKVQKFYHFDGKNMKESE